MRRVQGCWCGRQTGDQPQRIQRGKTYCYARHAGASARIARKRIGHCIACSAERRTTFHRRIDGYECTRQRKTRHSRHFGWTNGSAETTRSIAYRIDRTRLASVCSHVKGCFAGNGVCGRPFGPGGLGPHGRTGLLSSRVYGRSSGLRRRCLSEVVRGSCLSAVVVELLRCGW